ncbi:MAG: diguanylate cyclase [Gaiellales bacterium]
MDQSNTSQVEAGDSRLASYQALHEVSRMLLGTATLAELFDRITGELKRLVPYDALTVYRVDHVQELLVPVHAADQWARQIMESPISLGCGITGAVVDSGIAECLDAAHTDSRAAVVPGTPDDEPGAMVAVPLTVRDQTIGALNVHRLGRYVSFTQEEFELVCRFADMAALAIDNVENRNLLLQEAQTDWLTGLRNHRFFQEQLREELERAARYRRPLSMIIFDLDDFKLLNDVHGHQEGDMVLRRVAMAAGEELRASDVACRTGGEEFAILLPEATKVAARAAAERLVERVRHMPGNPPVTVSCGVATFPDDATNPTELVAAADASLYVAKVRGKDRAAEFSSEVARARATTAAADVESASQLRALGALAARLTKLTSASEVGETIVSGLRGMVDYHNVRVYVTEQDGYSLEPIAFRGMLTEYDDETLDALRTVFGEGITGRAAEDGRTLNIPDANACEFAVDVPGTDDIDESILAVPLRFDSRTVGIIVLSKLGIDQFSPLAVRIVELLAAQAAVALENARLYESERRATALAEGLGEITGAAVDDPSPRRIAVLAVLVARRLTGADAAVFVDTSAARPSVLAADGDPELVAVAFANVGPFTAAPSDVRVVSTDSAELCMAAVHGGVLVVTCPHASAAVAELTDTVAAQATLALRYADAVARMRHAG